MPHQQVGALDGLRAIAVLLVLLTHFTPGRNSNLGIESLLFKAADLGWFGVDLFFVLSGFLITRILLRLPTSTASYAQFVFHRLLRLGPVYFGALAVVFVIVPLTTQAYGVPAFGFQWWFWAYLSNYFSPGYSSLNSAFSVGHFWSLALEVQFYALWPMVLLTQVGRRNLFLVSSLLLLAALLFRFVCVQAGSPWYVTYGYLPSRMDGLLVGAAIASLAQRGEPRVAGGRCVARFGVIIGAIALSWIAWAGMGGWIFSEARNPSVEALRVLLPTAISLFFGCLVWLSLQDDAWTRWLDASAFKPLARWSYSVYVVHYLYFPVALAKFGPPILGEWFGLGGNVSVFAFFVLSAVLSVALGACLYRLVERPVLVSRLYRGTRG
jgi:peptidoglycan/LPS O-acetylase OafA/YrhL